MPTDTRSAFPILRARWAAIGAVVAICLGAGSFGVVDAVKSSGERSTYTPIPACRVADTRSNPEFNTGPKNTPLGDGLTMTVRVTGSNGNCSNIPSDVTGVALNVTTLHATHDTHITIWPDGPVPDASSLNPAPGTPPAPNAVTTKVAADGTFKVFNFQGSVNVIIDIVGYHQDHNHDDRYYSKGEVDEGLGKSKMMSIDPAATFSNGDYESGGATWVTGLHLDPLESLVFTIVLPPDATTGTAPVIDMYWQINETGCNVEWRTNWVHWSRLGRQFLYTDVNEIPYTTRGPIEDRELRRRTLEVTPQDPSSDSLQAGDILKVGVFRSTVGDTCTEPAVVDAIRVTYD